VVFTTDIPFYYAVAEEELVSVSFSDPERFFEEEKGGPYGVCPLGRD
jgi:hypothetical protein